MIKSDCLPPGLNGHLGGMGESGETRPANSAPRIYGNGGRAPGPYQLSYKPKLGVWIAVHLL